MLKIIDNFLFFKNLIFYFKPHCFIISKLNRVFWFVNHVTNFSTKVENKGLKLRKVSIEK